MCITSFVLHNISINMIIFIKKAWSFSLSENFYNYPKYYRNLTRPTNLPSMHIRVHVIRYEKIFNTWIGSSFSLFKDSMWKFYITEHLILMCSALCDILWLFTQKDIYFYCPFWMSLAPLCHEKIFYDCCQYCN